MASSASKKLAHGSLSLLLSILLMRCRPWFRPTQNFALPLPGRTGGQEPPEPEHGNAFVIDVANELWFAADDMLTAGSFMGDEGWANRGESPATLGSVGIALRNAAEALLYADWWTVAGELEVAGASGEFYFEEQDFLDIAGVLPEDFDAWDAKEASSTSSSAQAALIRMSDVMTDLADRVGDGSVAGQALRRTSENWQRAARLLAGEQADMDQ
eukprot:symbB.v1.2.003734.t1/scaffold176.1/size287750/16